MQPTGFLPGAVSGAAWAMGRCHAYGRIGVSRGIPISTGQQLVGSSLVGVLIFAALAMAVVGMALTAAQGKGCAGPGGKRRHPAAFVFYKL